ncbi:MAG: hypothetical protein HW380_1558 [Magnetococcales bacterium]|nr:hypothetical protein [Magnetococcales bacterium]
MSTTIAFDTHTYVKKLRDAGVDEPLPWWKIVL